MPTYTPNNNDYDISIILVCCESHHHVPILNVTNNC